MALLIYSLNRKIWLPKLLLNQRKALSLQPYTNIYQYEYKRQDITTELRGALQEVKDHIEGKKRLQSLDSLLDELITLFRKGDAETVKLSVVKEIIRDMGFSL